MDLFNENEDLISHLLQKMQHAAEEDRRLYTDCKPATKKLAILQHSMSLLTRKDLQLAFIQHNVLNVLTDWLTPLRNKLLPCIQIRENILKLLADFPAMNKELVEKSGIGQAVICLYQHPRESNANRDRAGQLIAAWNLCSTLKEITHEEHHQRITQKPQPSPTSSTSVHNDKENIPSVEDNRGAHVPKPWYNEYTVRPSSNVDTDKSIVLTFTKVKKPKSLSSRKRIAKKLLEMKSQHKSHSEHFSIDGNSKKI